LRFGEAIRQEPSEERIGNTVEDGDVAGVRRNATRRAGVFSVAGSSKGLPYSRYGPRLSPAHAAKSLRRSDSIWP
jgi:hypothetical protein